MKDSIYKRLTFSLSYTLPILVVSGVLFSIGFLFDPPLGSFLLDVSDYAYYLSYAVLAAGIAYAIADRVAIIPALLGGFIIMNGTMGLLGAALVGFFAGYLTKGIMDLFSSIPRLLTGMLPLFVYPVVVTLMTLGFTFLLNTYVDYYVYHMYEILFYDYRWLVITFSVILASFMAFDLGGPVNKIAYLIAIMTLADGLSSTIMAAVIAGGMVPPLVVAVIQLFNRKETVVKWWMTGILGLCFMTEGAISYVEQDKKTLVPMMMIGSGVAGGIVGWFGISTKLPHGGILVALFMNNGYLFLLAIAVGVVITLLIIVVFLRKINENIERKKSKNTSLQA